jgi:hypothetical protein
LDDAKRRRDAATAATPTIAELTERARQIRQQDLDLLDPLVHRLWEAVCRRCSARGYRRQFRNEWREQRLRRARTFPHPDDWESYATIHPLGDDVRVLIYGERGAVVVEATATIASSTFTLALNLGAYRWALGCWVTPTSEWKTELTWARFLSNDPNSAKGEIEAQRNNLMMLRPLDLSGQYRDAVEQLVTVFLDFYEIPYSEVEV